MRGAVSSPHLNQIYTKTTSEKNGRIAYIGERNRRYAVWWSAPVGASDWVSGWRIGSKETLWAIDDSPGDVRDSEDGWLVNHRDIFCPSDQSCKFAYPCVSRKKCKK